MDASLLSPPTLAVAAVCLAIGWVAHAAAAAPAAAASGASALLDDADSDPATDAIRMGMVKMVLCVRQDLKMTKGKIAAQCGHASLGMYMKLQRKAGALLASWFAHGQAKIALKVEDEESLVALKVAAQSAGLPTHIVVDAGRTQIAANTKTVLAILGPVAEVDAVTGSLKLL